MSVARTHRPDLADVLGGLYAAMLADPRGELATRVQQTSGMVMAKGVEDTTFYRWNRFVALNEVGGEPDRFGVSPAEFHAALAEREAARPDTMTTLSTHDTKRSEDVRARLAVLAEIPREWTDCVRRWSARHPLPDRSLELLAWQNLVGAWPIPVDRMAGYLTKASKEAKLVTSHVEAVPEVDEAVAAWPAAVLGRRRAGGRDRAVRRPDQRARLVELAGPEAAAARGPGRARRLPGHRSLRVLAGRPGQPQAGRLGGAARPARPASTTAGCRTSTRTGRRSCWSRRARCGCAGTGRRCSPGYRPLPADGPAAAHAVAFQRSPSLVAVATRLPVGLAARGGWGDTVLPLPDGAADWHDVVTDTAVDGAAPRLAELLARYPVALLVRPA